MLASVGRVAAQRLAPRRIAASSSGYIVRVGRLAALQPRGSSALLGAAFTKRTYAAAAAASRPKKTAAGKTATATKAKPRKTDAAAAAPTKKAAPKKKTVKAKADASKTKKQPVARRPKKVLSEEEKTEKKLTAQRRLWKQKAMLGAEPRNLPSTAWQVYMLDSFANPIEGESLKSHMNRLSAEFKALSSAELQRLNDIAEQNKVQNAAQYKAWVVSHTPLEIYEAMKARKLLKLKFNFPKTRKTWERIHDDRQPKRPTTSYFYFARARLGAGEGGNGTLIERQRNLGETWKTMGPAERQPYIDLAMADRTRFAREAQAVGLSTRIA